MVSAKKKKKSKEKVYDSKVISGFGLARCLECDWTFKRTGGGFLAAVRHLKKTGHTVVAKEVLTKMYICKEGYKEILEEKFN